MKNGRQRSVITQTLGYQVKNLRFQPNEAILL